MSELDLLKKIKEQRSFILWTEIAAFLHDLGKLSNSFYEYRQSWRRKRRGWWEDPHDHDFLDGDKLIDKYKILKEIFKKIPHFMANTQYEGAQDCCIEKFVNTHIRPKDDLIKLFAVSDGKDAAQDRNNPLFTAEQEKSIYDTDVFGSEFQREFDQTATDKIREGLYGKLEKILPKYFETYLYEDRKVVLDTIRKNFDKVLSDTRRPDNDTSLWEHCYAVASIFKVLLVHNLIYNEKLDQFQKVHFGIMGVGWDGVSFISYGHKVGDIVGRVETIENLKGEIKRLFEYEYLLGNCIYEDINGIYFLIPFLPQDMDFEKTDFDKLGSYGKLLQQIKLEIIDTALKKTGGDLYPHFHFVQDTAFMTKIVQCIQGLFKKIGYPLTNPDENVLRFLQKEWEKESAKTVCPICKRRPIDEKLEICKVCYGRRKRVYGRRGEDYIIGTPFIQEIVKANEDNELKKRACLIVAKFKSDRWLNGKMIRSLFITEAKGLEKEIEDLGNTKSFEVEEKKAKKWLENSRSFGNLVKRGYDYRRIKKEIDLCYNFDSLDDDKKKEYARNILFLYDRRTNYVHGEKESIYKRHMKEIKENWKRWEISTIEEYSPDGQPLKNRELLCNILCAKTPTPSTVLDVWMTTKKFFEEIGQEKDGKVLWIEKKSRFIATIPKPNGIDVGAAYEGSIGGEDVEVVWTRKDDDSGLLIGSEYNEETKKSWENANITLKGKPLGEKDNIVTGPITDLQPNEFYPIRIIATTPELFLAIAPADKAIEITKNIYNEYIKQFGKAMGRLPFSIGNIFFEEKTPMFVVLDSARRMLNNFEKLAEQSAEIRVSKDHHKDMKHVNGEERLSIKFDQVTLLSRAPMEREWEWCVPYQRGNNDIDYFHPYVVVKEGSKDYSYRKNYFKTVAGSVVHFTELEPGDMLELYLNYYDFEFLDSATRRYEIALDQLRRKSTITPFFSKPYLLDELEQGLERLWEGIKDGKLMPDITDTKLRNIESLWLSKLEEWGDEEQWRNLVEATVRKEFPVYKNLMNEKLRAHFEWLKNSILSGLFFDCLELNLTILKKGLKERRGET
ncbi:MAG: CRISPR-associated protein Csx11 [Nitrospirota bacterium]